MFFCDVVDKMLLSLRVELGLFGKRKTTVTEIQVQFLGITLNSNSVIAIISTPFLFILALSLLSYYFPHYHPVNNTIIILIIFIIISPSPLSPLSLYSSLLSSSLTLPLSSPPASSRSSPSSLSASSSLSSTHYNHHHHHHHDHQYRLYQQHHYHHQLIIITIITTITIITIIFININIIIIIISILTSTINSLPFEDIPRSL